MTIIAILSTMSIFVVTLGIVWVLILRLLNWAADMDSNNSVFILALIYCACIVIAYFSVLFRMLRPIYFWFLGG